MEALLRLVRRLLSKEQRRFVKFCIVGTSGVPVNLVCTWLAYHGIFFSFAETSRKAAAYLFGILISTFTNFLLNDVWTWRDRDAARGFPGRLLRFFLVSSVASGIQFGTAMGLSVGLGVHYLVAQLVGIVVAMAVNFVVNNLWTFRARSAGPTASPQAPPVAPPTDRAPPADGARPPA